MLPYIEEKIIDNYCANKKRKNISRFKKGGSNSGNAL